MSDQQMTAREFLQQAQNIEAQIRLKEERLQTLKEMMSNTSARIRDTPRSASPNQQPLEYFVAASVDLQKEIDQDRKTLMVVRNDIGNVIKQVEDTRQKQVLELFYMGNRSLEQVSAMIGFSTRNVTRWHTKGLIAVEKVRGSG